MSIEESPLLFQDMFYEGAERMADEIHRNAVNKGFWDADVDVHYILAKLALVHSEVSETLEAIRKNKGSEIILEEMADIIIRVLDLYKGMVEYDWISDNYELFQVVSDKMNINKQRPRLHGNLA